MRQNDPIAPPAEAPEANSGEDVGSARFNNLHEYDNVVNSLATTVTVGSLGEAGDREAVGMAPGEWVAGLEVLRVAIRACFAALLDAARPEIEDDRLARAVARGAVAYVEKVVRAGLRLSSPEEAASLLKQVTRAGCGFALAKLALQADESTRLMTLIDARQVELCRPIRRGSLTLAGRAHLELIREKLAERTIRGTLPTFTRDEDRARWLIGVSKNLRREGARLELGPVRRCKRGAGGGSTPPVAVAVDVEESAIPVFSRVEERMDAALSTNVLTREFPALVAHALRDDETLPVPGRVRVWCHRERAAARRMLAARDMAQR